MQELSKATTSGRYTKTVFTTVLAALCALTGVESKAEVAAYFNHAEDSAYREEYRPITRQGHNLEQIIVTEMEKAQHRLWVAVQELRLPSLAKVMAAKARAGVDVRLVLENQYNYSFEGLTWEEVSNGGDYSASRKMEYFTLIDKNRDHYLSRNELEDRAALYILKKAGVKIIDDTADGSKGTGLMHHKFVVIDDTRLVVTSANFTLSDVHGDLLKPETRGNANALLVMDDRKLNETFAEEFSILWGDGVGNKNDSKFGAQKPHRGAQQLRLRGGEDVTVQFAGSSKSLGFDESTSGLVARTVGSAQKSVDMALFVFSDQEIVNSLEENHRTKSLNVRALIEPSFAYRYYSQMLDMWGLEMLSPKCKTQTNNRPWRNPIRSAGVPRLAQGDFLHHKFAVLDDDTVVFGSFNWSDSANYGNDETLMVIRSPRVARAFKKEFDRVYSNSVLGAPSWLVKQAEKEVKRCSRGPGDDQVFPSVH